MQHRMKRGWSIEAALAIALFLVVQAFFSGLSIGARADTLDSSGEVLCLGSRSIAADNPAAPSNRDHLDDCCTLGCPMLGGLAAPAAEPTAFALVWIGPAPRPAGNAHHPGRFELSPLHSRAPPQA